ncbi:aconitate hydratase [Lecanosticta acicola]|uniref:Large ribosomal subunit protein bL21m n=1 Tax=Lecanosticta acicola TaxID=111012 RepID=A0AAI8Z310_9PEZI|nr:aconitate hydratase [Lecanosticta acicola]
MLSKTLKRALLDSPSQLPPTFLLPWAAALTTSATAAASAEPQTSETATRQYLSQLPLRHRVTGSGSSADTKKSASTVSSRRSQSGITSPSPSSKTSLQSASTTARPTFSIEHVQSQAELPPPRSGPISDSIRELLPIMLSQGPHYITVHIHGNQYLVTEGDTVRLPFLMHHVEPGDVIRLNRAINLGSRDFTIKAAANPPKLKSPTATTTVVLDQTSGDLASHSRVMPASQTSAQAPHYVPHIAKGKHSYLDERLFVCRAVVMGVESEPMRIKEKTKRRQRHVRKVKSKHRYTILKIKELRLRSLEELDDAVE